MSEKEFLDESKLPNQEKAKSKAEELTKGLNALLDFMGGGNRLKEIGLGEYFSEFQTIVDKIVAERKTLDASSVTGDQLKAEKHIREIKEQLDDESRMRKIK